MPAFGPRRPLHSLARSAGYESVDGNQAPRDASVSSGAAVIDDDPLRGQVGCATTISTARRPNAACRSDGMTTDTTGSRDAVFQSYSF